jgi:DNA invertase Pin-like site-specific DNA recombinase
MAEGKYISYLRVSTKRQGVSGLGLEAQRKAVADYLNGGRWKLLKEFVEVESGKDNDRKELRNALGYCRLHGAKLIVARFDRLSRNAAFLMTLRDSGTEFVAADMPGVANTMTVGVMALVAQQTRETISANTRAALAAAKARGVKLGNPRNLSRKGGRRGNTASQAVRSDKAAQRAQDMAPVLAEIQAEGTTSLRALAAALNDREVPTPSGQGEWSAVQVSRVLTRLNEAG